MKSYRSDIIAGVFAMDGERWHNRQNLISNMLSRNFALGFCGCNKNLLLELDEDGNAEGGFKIHHKDVFFWLTIDMASLIAFGVDLNSVNMICSTILHLVFLKTPIF